MTTKRKDGDKYELLPPEGGWGYVVAAAVALGLNVTLIPMMGCFGLIFGNFLAGIGDETTGTTIANGVFNTFFNLTGLLASSLLQMYSYRIVTFMGAILFSLGCFATVFVTSLPQLVVSFGVIEGLGMGLLFPALLTALNAYFDKRLTLMNSISQAVMIATSMVFPYVCRYWVVSYGFRATLALLAACSLNTFVAAAVLQPVEWHFKKKVVNFLLEENKKVLPPKLRRSIISLADRAASVTTLDKTDRRINFKRCLDLSLFKDPVYVNIAMGLALGYTSDVAFISILPLLLQNSGYDFGQRSFFVSIFFAADLVARVLLSVASVFWKVRNRYLFLGGAFICVVFRIAFVLRDDFYWKLVIVCCLGFSRCFIQTPLPVVIAEQYPDNFSTAFSLYMAVCGVVSLIFGPLMSWVKAWTHSDVMVVHTLTLAYLTCVVSWSIELMFCKKRRSK